MRPRRLFASAVATVAALTWPAGALAHAVRNPLVATNFEARVAAVRIDRGAVPAKVVDGDRQLWLCVRAGVAGRWSVPFSIKPAQEDTPKADVQFPVSAPNNPPLQVGIVWQLLSSTGAPVYATDCVPVSID